MIRQGEKLICPDCGGLLKFFDRVTRKCRKEYGEIEKMTIRRFRCCECGKTHRELPDFLLPYKQFTANIINGVIDGSITPYELEYEDYPCEMTMKRWINANGNDRQVVLS